MVRQPDASLTTHAPDQLITILQEAGYAAGEGLYKAFAAVNNPTDLDADLLGETLSEFFKSGGWGKRTSTPRCTGAPPLGPHDRVQSDAGSPPTRLCFSSPGLPSRLPRPPADLYTFC